MRKILFSLVLSTLVLFNKDIFAQNVTWNFATASPSSNTATNVSVSDVTQGNNNGTTTMVTSTSASSGYPGASGTNNAGVAAFTGTLNTATSTYFQFTITPASGFTFTLAALSFGSRSTGTGPQAYAIRSSIDNYASDVASGTLANNSTWGLQTPSVTVSSSNPVTFRIYGFNGTGSPAINTANWRIDDLALTLNTALPVTLISFKASLNSSNQAVLKWATASEKDNHYFEIERSKNAIDFVSLGKLNGKGTSDLRNDYAFTDETPLKGINYYRLKQVDFDGTFSYTRPESVITEGDGSISLYPNPTVNVLKINFEDLDQIETTTIYNQSGVMMKNLQGSKSSIDIQELPQGKYILQIRLADQRIITNSFVKF